MTNILMSRSSTITKDYSYKELSKILKPNMKVVVLGFSFFDELSSNNYFNEYGRDSEYALKIANNFKLYNITNIKWIYYYETTHEESVKLIKEADIIYFPGGAPDLMMKRIKEKNLLEALRAFNKIVIGSSAGAMIQLGTYHISPDNEYHKFSINEGLGYLNNFFVEVHYNRRKKQKSSMRKVRREYKNPIYTIPDDGLLIVFEDKTIKCINTAKKMYDSKGIVK